MTLPSLLLSALLGLAPIQGAPEGAPRSPRASADGSWQLINQVHIVVNEDVVTLAQLENRVQRMLAAQPVSSPAEMSALRGEVATRAVQELLMVQRGRDLGFDPEFVKRTVADYMRDQAEEAGGVSELAEKLSLSGETAAVRRSTITDELYAVSYERAITGQAPGPGGRPNRDRYVRPGMLALGYEQAGQEPAAVRAIGGEPEAWILQQLVLEVATFGAVGEAQAYLEDLRAQALDGLAEFDELVDTYSLVRENRGLSRPLTLAELRQLEPRVAQFCTTGQVGDLSEVLPIEEQGQPVFLRVLRIDEHRPLQLPAFRDAALQERLRQVVLRNRDLSVREESVRGLFQGSYIWTPETIRSPEPAAAPGAAR